MATTFKVEKIHCQSCAKRVTNAVLAVAPGAKVDVDVAGGRVSVEPANDPAAIASAITKAGYPATAP